MNQKDQNVFIAFHKPLGPFLAPLDEAEQVIGSLNDSATGLMIFTDRKNRLRLESEYVVTVDRLISKPFLATLRTETEAISIKKITDRKFKIILFDAELDEVCKKLGYRITSLKRIQLGPVKLKELGEGNQRQLTKKERQELENLL